MSEYSLGTAELGTVVSLDGLQAGIDDAEHAATSGFSKIGDIIGGALKVGLAVAATGFLALGGAIVSGIGDAREAAQIMGQTEAAITSTGGAAGKTAEQIGDLASSLSAAEGKSLFGDSDIQLAENLLLTFTNLKGEIFDSATAISVDMAQALGGAPKDQAIALGKALNDPVAGITALTRVGVTFTEQQKAQIQAMQDAGDMAGAQKVILAELNKEFGGSAEAAAKADGGWAQFNDRLGEAKETLGAAVLPFLSLLVGVLNDSVMPVLEAGAAAFGDLVAAFQTGAEADGMIGGLTNALYSLGGVSPIFDTIGDAVVTLADTLPGVFAQIGQAVQPAIDVLAGFAGSLAATFSDAATPIEGLLNVVSRISPTFDLVRATIETSLPIIQQIVEQVFGFVQTFIDQHGADVVATLADAWTKVQAIIDTATQLVSGIVLGAFLVIRDFLAAHGDDIQNILSNVWTIIKNVVLGALEIIQGVLSAALKIFQGDWQGAWEAIQAMSVSVTQRIWEVIKAALDLIANFFGTSLSQIAETWRHNFEALPGIITGLRDRFLAAGRDIINGVIAGVQAAAGALMDTLRNIASDALQAAKDALGISSPSKVFAEVGSDVIAGWLEGMADSFPDLLSEFADMGEELAELAEQIRDTISDTMAGVFSAGASIYQQRAKNRDFIAELGKDVTTERKKVQKEIAATEDKLAKDRAKEKPDAGRIKELEAELALLQEQETALKERERQMHSFRQRQENLVAQAEQTAAALFADDPKRQAAFFALRSKQIQQLAKLEEALFAATTQAERDRIQADIDDIKKAQELEIAAFMEEARQGNATFGDLTDEYEDLTKKREAMLDKRAELESQLANEKDDERRQALQEEIDALTDEITGMDALIEEIEALIAALTATEEATASAGGSTSTATMSVSNSGAAKSASTLSQAEYVNYTVTLRLEDERSSLLKDLIRTEVREELADAGWRGDTRGR